MVEKDVIHTDSSIAFDLLFSSFFVFVAHVHDSRGRRPVVLVTVHAFEVLVDLIRHAAVLTHTDTKCVWSILRLWLL